VGCGGYANRYGAVSATGHGEANLGGGGEFSIEFLLGSGYKIHKLRNPLEEH
jgi:isoaspartyl peptidase/L-asparaginase-like protein (Ntn-hydrolase superfamily)